MAAIDPFLVSAMSLMLTIEQPKLTVTTVPFIVPSFPFMVTAVRLPLTSESFALTDVPCMNLAVPFGAFMVRLVLFMGAMLTGLAATAYSCAPRCLSSPSASNTSP
eukprot:3088812-Rhodomonas_salina.1